MAEQQQKKFSLERAVAGKRAAVETPEKTARKIPKVSQMQPTEPRPQRVTTNAAVVICVYPVTDSAGDLWAQYKDTDEKLWQIQLDHDARPSVSVNIRRSLEEYLKESKDGLPGTIQKLQSDCGIKLTMSGKEDPDSLGCFVQYRIGFYVAGDIGSLVNFFLFLDGHCFSLRNNAKGPAPPRPLPEKPSDPPIAVSNQLNSFESTPFFSAV